MEGAQALGVAWAQLGEQIASVNLAIVEGRRVTANPSMRGKCPCCGSEVLAKCGSIVSWHWAHESADCDLWSEPESDWHLGWKRRFPELWQEVVVGNHRADVKTPKLVVEFQASSISAEEIQERERHYRNMVWLLRGEDFQDNLCFRKRDGFYTFRWRWPRRSWWAAKMPIVFSFADDGDLFHVKKIHQETPCGGWGYIITQAEFLRRCGDPPPRYPSDQGGMAGEGGKGWPIPVGVD